MLFVGDLFLNSDALAGKDTPSRASEFSNPDVAVGLTILAYRHAGLRRADLVAVVRALQQQLGREGPGVIQHVGVGSAGLGATRQASLTFTQAGSGHTNITINVGVDQARVHIAKD